MRKIVMRDLKEGEKIPIGYGFAWENFDEDRATCIIVPFNIILRWLRNIWLFLAKRPRKSIELAAYNRGFNMGYAMGKNATQKEILEIVEKTIINVFRVFRQGKEQEIK